MLKRLKNSVLFWALVLLLTASSRAGRAAAVTDLRVAHAVTDTGHLIATLQWTPLPQAFTTTLRYSTTYINDDSWAKAIVITDALPGAASSFTAVVPYSDSVTLPYDRGTRYFALKSQDAQGTWSGLSNVASWPAFEIHLPLVFASRGGG